MSRMLRACSMMFFMSLMSNVSAIDQSEVFLAYFGDGTAMAALGVEQGVDEANIQGEFLGQKYVLKMYDQEHLMVVPNVAAILASLDEAGLRDLAKKNKGLPIFNLTDDSHSLRENCVENLFHTIPSQKMTSDAVAQWQQKNPESKAVATGWNSDFKKYAAGQVSKRFKDIHEKSMDDPAYAGWIAMKAIADSVARTSSMDGEKLIPYLKNDLVIDGAKGVKMTFRSTGQLRQMMFLVEDGKIVGEAPVRGVVEVTDLDSLGVVECVPYTDQ